VSSTGVICNDGTRNP